MTLRSAISGTAARRARAEVLRLAWPAILEMMLHMGIWIVDTAMVGRLGAAALSATGLGGQVYFSLIFVLGGIGVATTAMVSRHVGAGEGRQAGFVAGQALVLGLVAAAGLAVAVQAGAHLIYDLASLGPAVGALGTTYMRIISLGAPLLVVNLIANGALRATGDTRTPLLIAATVNALNAIFDYLLIFGVAGLPRLGVAGAALASLTAQVAGGILGLVALARQNPAFRPRWAGWRPHWETIRRLVRLSIPAALESLFMDGARTVNMFAVSGLGVAAFAASQVAVAAESLSFLPGYGFTIAASILVGQKLGARAPGEARNSVVQALLLALAVMSSMGLFFLVMPRFLVGFFTRDAAVVDLAARCLMIAALVQPAIATTEVLTGALRGAGDTRTAMYVTAFGSWGLRVPLTYLGVYAFGFSLAGVWLIMVLDWFARSLLAAVVFRRGRWQEGVI